MTEKNEATPFDYLKSDINGISLADAYKQGGRDAGRMVAEEIEQRFVYGGYFDTEGQHTRIAGFSILEVEWQDLKSKL